MRQSTSFELDLIRLVFEMMEGGGNITINRVEDGHGREEGDGDGRHNNCFEAYTANEKHRYGLRYELISDLISEKFHFISVPISE
jgi:hypothetical protein